jgi:hypothetical protein
MARLAALAACACVTASLVFLALPAASASASAARVVVAKCDRDARSAAFEGRMDARAGAERMQMRFRLQIREPGSGRWERLQVAGFEAWETSVPGRSRYVFTRRLRELPAPAEYRVRVRFRWLDAAGDPLATAAATSRTCRQPDPRPDLVVTRIAVRAAVLPTDRRYVVTVGNNGRGDAPESSLGLSLAGAPPLLERVGALAPGERFRVTFVAPACAPGTAVLATADAGERVDERDEDANVRAIACP